MKIICVDNFDRENRSDYLVASNLPELYAKKIVEWLNSDESKFGGPNSVNYYKAVDDDHQLYVFQP